VDLQLFFRARSNESLEYINISKSMESIVYMVRKSGFAGGYCQNAWKKTSHGFLSLFAYYFGFLKTFTLLSSVIAFRIARALVL